MHVRHIIAAGLLAILSVEAAGLAQSAPAPPVEEAETITVPHRDAMHRLFEELMKPGADRQVRFEVAGGAILEGSVLEVSDDDVTISDHRLRRVVPLTEIVSLRPPSPGSGMQRGTAFGIGAGVGAGAGLGILILMLASLK